MEQMKAEILKIVEERGKFQDPVTKSGGILIGTVKEIGAALQGKTEAEVGDRIATLVSLSLTPLKIYEITGIDTDTEQVFCKADAILFESGIYTKLPEDLGAPSAGSDPVQGEPFLCDSGAVHRHQLSRHDEDQDRQYAAGAAGTCAVEFSAAAVPRGGIKRGMFRPFCRCSTKQKHCFGRRFLLFSRI